MYLIWFVFVRVVGNQGYVSRKCIHWKIFEQIGIGKAYLTLLQIWKSPYVLVKQCPENFPFLILVILELSARKFCKFLKK